MMTRQPLREPRAPAADDNSGDPPGSIPRPAGSEDRGFWLLRWPVVNDGTVRARRPDRCPAPRVARTDPDGGTLLGPSEQHSDKPEAVPDSAALERPSILGYEGWTAKGCAKRSSVLVSAALMRGRDRLAKVQAKPSAWGLGK